ncbi:hypothetical protein GCM10007853_17190 [Algimonas ampicilliniresistens]|uniref:DUF2274 domain-containing protein n=1 Tax=Algimonas ampicilliniresistens TaxID=1298735 RepID=A0ABQ5V9W8_9PROT|nr:DUF2274 domain-containing protein [Algimonas ampicilliniresistens]GLQ23845.1 hypothetical protein GCM10007853_17190 [Algimonas ampicilliniresistens]
MSDTQTPTLRIAKLPDLTPVKMTIHVEPETYRMLEDYARLYAQSYGEEVAAATLVPSMLASFLASDSGFKKARKTLSNTD